MPPFLEAAGEPGGEPEDAQLLGGHPAESEVPQVAGTAKTARGPLKRRADHSVISSPIQATDLVDLDGKLQILTATLIQPGVKGAQDFQLFRSHHKIRPNQQLPSVVGACFFCRSELLQVQHAHAGL